MSSTSSGKSTRILACQLCQHRKIKCDRNMPCANCLKANVACTPSTPAPARKRRRPNQDLQQRLARCEELLQEYAKVKPSGPGSGSSETPVIDGNLKSLGSLIIDDSGPRFMDSQLWATVHNEVRAMRDIIDEEDVTNDDTSTTPAEGQTPDHTTGLLLSEGSDTNLDSLHPEPAQVFRLWQTFIERVNPLTKVVHIPSVQPLVVEATTNRSGLSKNVTALLFSIYTISTVALSDQECITMLGLEKDDAYNRFSKGARVALMRIGILSKHDLTVLQALVLYMGSLAGRYDRHAAWIFNGTIIRVAQKLGLHRDGESLGLSPFETEIRRRVWWQIILLDAHNAFMSGLGPSLMPRQWDTKPPGNINDVDLFPAATKIEPKDGPTDMILCLLNYEMAKFITNPIEFPNIETIILHNERGSTPSAVEVDMARRSMESLNQALGDIVKKYGDPNMGPLHELAFSIPPSISKKLRELTSPLQEQPGWGSELRSPKDHYFKLAVSTAEEAFQIYSLTEKGGYFLWSVMTHFQVDVFIFMIGQLCTRTSGQLVDRAWVVAEQIYHYHTELFKLSIKPHDSLAYFAIKAWSKREEAVRAATGSLPVKPYFIHRLQELLGSNAEVEEAAFKSEPPPSQTLDVNGYSTDVELPWLGMMDNSGLSWDMFEATAHPNTQFGSYGAGMGNFPSMNGWM